MTADNSNVAVLKEAFERWNDSKGQSTDHWLSIMADDVDFRSLAEGRDPGFEFTARRRCCDEVADYLKGLTEQLEMIHYTVEFYVAEGDRVVAVGTTAWRNRATGKSFDTPKVDVVRFKDGKIVEFFEFYDTAMVTETGNPE